MAMSNWLQAQLMNRLFGGAAFTLPANYYAALYTTAPTNAGGGVEVSGVGTAYARLAIPNNTARFGVSGSSPTTASNIIVLTWAQATANWGTVLAIALFDAAIGGNFHWWANLAVNKAVNTGDVPSLPIGVLDFTLG